MPGALLTGNSSKLSADGDVVIPVPEAVKQRIDFLAKLYLENGDIVEAARTAKVSPPEHTSSALLTRNGEEA